MNDPTVKRLNISPYQDSEYSELERQVVSKLRLPYLSWKEKADPAVSNSFLLISNTHTNWELQNKQLLDKTKLIIHPNSGYDNFSLNFLRQIECPVILGNPIRAHAVTNYILASLFEHFSKIPQKHSWDQERSWKRSLLFEKNILIIGYGHIGKLLEKSLTPLCKNVFIHDPYEDKNLNLNDYAKMSDIVIPVAGLNRTSKHLIGKEFLHFLPENFLLINGARGGLVDTNALFKVLRERPLSFAYLDVFEEEPFDFRSVDHLKNICLSSHIAGCFKELDQFILNFVSETLHDFKKLSMPEFLNKYDDLLLQNKIIGNDLI